MNTKLNETILDILLERSCCEIHEEYENFANNCKQTTPTDISAKIIKKKYETIKINVIDVTKLTNDS